jgi:(hydroxyamino)benzene mutase
MHHGPKVLGVSAPDRHLLVAGVLLFLIGLLTGFAIPLLAAPRLGLSSHLEGVLNGMFLIGLGLLWSRLVLPAWAATATFVLALYGTYANWFATLLAAMWGAAGMMPIAGGGASAAASGEAIVAGLLASLSLAMIAVCLFVLWGLRRTP